MCKREREYQEMPIRPPARRPRPRLEEENSTNILLSSFKNSTTFGAFFIIMKSASNCFPIISLANLALT